MINSSLYGRYDTMKLFGRKKSEPHVDLEHLTPKGELPDGWYHANHDFTETISEEYRYFFEEWQKAQKEGAKKEYIALKSLVIFMEDIKQLCATKGECFAFWASISVAVPEDIAKKKERLQYMGDNMTKLIQEEEERHHLETRLLETIKSTPGISESNVYKLFDDDMKNLIQQLLYKMARDDLITRKKSGLSYKLYLKS